MSKGHKKFIDSLNYLENFCWQFRPDGVGCPLSEGLQCYNGCVIRHRFPTSMKKVDKLLTEWENEKDERS